ncbi:MAG TPA: hypothetical protein PLP90_03035 [Methanoculleus sp.]|nr:hypothetical protein [Methanoculleus sp.]
MDRDYQLIRRFETTTASLHDSRIDLSRKGGTIYRDKGYFGVKPQASMDKTMYRATRGHPLSIKEYRRNKAISRTRSLVKRPFAWIKTGVRGRTSHGHDGCPGPRQEHLLLHRFQSPPTSYPQSATCRAVPLEKIQKTLKARVQEGSGSAVTERMSKSLMEERVNRNSPNSFSGGVGRSSLCRRCKHRERDPVRALRKPLNG